MVHYPRTFYSILSLALALVPEGFFFRSEAGTQGTQALDVTVSVFSFLVQFLVATVHTSLPEDVHNMYFLHVDICRQAIQTKSEGVLLIKDSEYCSE